MRAMSAKHPKKSASKPALPAAAASPAATPSHVASGAGGAVAAVPAAAEASWLDSSDPRKRMWGKIIFAGVCLYVAALWLLALDQTFDWGIFGPKVPPVP